MAVITKYKNLPTQLKTQLREKVDNTCSVCGGRVKKVWIHHKDTNHFNQDSNNLQLVCRRCHIEIHKLLREQSKLIKTQSIKIKEYLNVKDVAEQMNLL